MGQNIENGFVEYRYLHCKHLDAKSPALTFKFKVNQVDATVDVAWAVCSENDNFARAVGRKITDDRLDNGKTITVGYDRALSLVGNAIFGMDSIVDANENHGAINPAVVPMYQEIKRAVEAYIEIKTCFEFHEMFAGGVDDINDIGV